MVFESIVVDVLNRVLGDYVENLDSKQLSIGIWGGDVVLQDLVLKQTALEDLNLPIQVVYGRLGKLVLKIPWKNLYGAPVEAVIERLYLLVVPNLQVKYDPIKEEKIEQSAKQADLARIENAKKKEAEQGKTKTDDTFAEKLTTQIIKNVQVKIKDIHIRYEDSVANPNKPFAFGITLSNLCIETTDDQWRAAIVNDAASKIFKVLNLDALAVYLNCNCSIYSKMSINDILNYMSEGIATRDSKARNYAYVLGPINSSARLRLNPKPENDTEPFSVSKMLLNLEMEKLALGISKNQYQDIMCLADSMGRMNRGLPYRKYRPFVNSYKSHYKEWWHFAYTCILEEEVRRRRRNWDWTHIQNHRALCKNYAIAYQAKLQNKKIPANVQEELDHTEKKLDLFNLVIIRQRIELEVARLNKKTEEQKAKSSWFSGWWGKPANSEDAELSATADIMKQFQEAMTPQEKAKLFRAIDYQENSAPAEYPEAFVATNCAFVLRSLEIEIRDDSLDVPRVLSTTLKGVNCRLQQRPAAKGLKVAVKIDEFTVYGLQQKTILPQLVSSDEFVKDSSVLLDVLFEMNPLDKKCDQRLHIKSLPLKVVYDAQTIIKVADVFKAQQSLTLDELQAATANKIADFKEMSALGLQHAVEKHVVMDLDINLSAPYIIVPHNGLYDDPKSLLVINLGNVKMRSVVRDLEAINVQKMHREGTNEDDILKELMSQSYDKFQIELSDMQILIANAGEDWGTCISENTITPMHLLQPVNLIVNVNKCLVTDDPRLPKLKINGQLPSIMLNICDDRILAVISLLTSIPSPDSADIQPAPLNSLVAKASALSLHNFETQTKKRNEQIQRLNNLDEQLIQATDLELKFEMKELVVMVCNRVLLKSEKIMEFRCMSLEIDMTQQTFNTQVMLRLGGIGLTHFRPQNDELQIISTPMTSGQDQYLFSVNFLQVNKHSPEFHAKYGSCEQQLQFNFTSLSLLLHQESIQELMHLANDFQKSLEGVTSQEGKDRISTAAAPRMGKQLSVIEEISTKTKQSGTSIKPRRYGKMVIETILFKLIANMGEFDILISSDKHQIASFAIKGVNTSIIMKKSYTAIKATLTDLNIFDCNPKSIHSKILCKTVNEEDALNAKIVLFNNDVKKREMVDADISVDLQMSGVKITFLNLFVSTVLDFLNNFQAAQQKIIDASAAAAEQAKNNLQSAYENASKIDLNIKLKAPVIIIPTNSTSYDALMIDLGNIELTNNFLKLEIQNEIGKSALVDDLILELLNMKISRVLLNKHLDKTLESTILKPLTLTLNIKRNLSASWYNMIPNIDIAGKVKSIHLKINNTDYAKIMQVLSENISEKKDVQIVKLEEKGRRIAKRLSVDLIPEHKVIIEEIQEEKPHTALRFTFTMESMVVSLFKTENKFTEEEQSFNADEEEGLARFTLLVLSIKGRILSDNSMSTSILLVDCLLDDTRSGHKGNITRLMERKENDALKDACNCVVPTAATTSSYSHDILKSMIDITYQQKGNDMFADVRVYSFNLILSIDYLMKIAAFFSINENAAQDPEISSIKTQKAASVSVKSRQDSNSKASAAVQEDVKSMTLNLKVEKPDIILVERMDNIDANALILNNEIVLNVRIVGRNQSIRGSITDLQLYTCCFNPAKRHETKNPVLHPCNINVVGSTPIDKGLHVDVTLTDIRLSVSPAVIELLSQCQRTMTGADIEAAENTENIVYYQDIWDPKPFADSDYWFLKTEQGQDALESTNFGNYGVHIYKELCNVSALSIVVTIEAGVGTNTLPMLLLETSFEANVRNWSSKLSIESSLSMQMAYYNSRLAVWEPLIEPVEVMLNDRLVHTPWTLKIELKKNEQEELGAMSPQSDDMEEIAFTQPTISILVSSSVNLEIVVTKTLLDVLTNLGKAFQNAVKVGIPIKDADTAPYKVVNDSGLKITLNLDKSNFMLYNKDASGHKDYKEIVLEIGAQVKLDLNPDNEPHQIMNKKSVSELKAAKLSDKSLNVFVHDMKCTLSLPVVRADKRYFPLNYRGENNDSWGLISDIAVQGAETIITLRSMLQVHNHFNQPVNVYYMTNRGNELESIKQVPPNTSVNLPMHGVYTLTNELFFSVEGHSVTAIPYVWKDLQHNLSMAKTLTCPAGTKQSQQPFVMKVCGDIEQIYYENTCKHTMASTCYNIHLRPAVTFKNCLPIPVICLSQGIVDECVVNPGEHLNLPTVNPGFSYMIIRLSNYLEKEWSCKHDILSNIPEFSVWQFDSHDSLARMSLDLGMHCENKAGTMILSLYCPFWMLNKTNLMLSYRNSDECVNILHHPEDFKGPILFSFAAKNFFGKKKAAIRVKNGEWSDKFSLDVAGSSGMVVCKADGVIHQIGVHNQLTYNGLTKQVTFTPYFVLINNTHFEIECQELERPADPWVKVEINSCKPLWPKSERDDKLLKLRIHGTTEISAPFLFTEVHTTLLKLPNKYGGINVDVQVTEGGIYITFTPYAPGLAPALIINHSDMELSLWEKESVNVKHLKSKHRLLHTWENPTGPRLLLWETGKKKEIEDDLRKDGLGEFCLVEGRQIYWVSFLDGMQRILLFTEDMEIARDAQSAGDLENIQQEITVSIHGLGISLVNNIIRQELLYIGVASSGIIWETCKMNSKRYKQLSVKESLMFEASYNQYLLNEADMLMPIMVDPRTEVDFQQELMLRPHKRKIRRSFQTGLWLQMKTSPNQMQLHAKINRVQIDNQMYDCIFPVILAPVPPPKSVAADSALKPFAELSIVQRIMKHSTVQQYKYFKVLIQEFHIKVDLGFVNALMAMFSAEEKSESEEVELFIKDMSLVDEPLLAHVSTQSLQEQKNFYDLLHFSPLKIHVSFSLAAPSGGGQVSGNTPAFLNVLLQGLGVTLTDMQDVVFRLAYFEREYSFLTQKQLSSEATSHYVGQFVKQLYVLVLGLDVIGNPYGLVLGISKGVEDLFYEPFQGAIQGPGEFAEGLVLGVRSLFGHTVGGAAGAVSRITGAMGKGIAALTFDKDYQRKRRDQINKKPANIQEGIARGGKGLVMGVVDGVTGVFTKPVRGAKEQGVEGFFKGLGKGAVGLVTRPTAGVIDFASGSLDAVKRATEMGNDVVRLRAPRFMRTDGLVRPYMKQEAEGNKLLTELEKGKYANTDIYAYHTWIVQEKDILLLTDKRLAYVVHNDIFGGWQMEWSYTWKEVNNSKVVDRGVQITASEPKKKVLGLFGSGEQGKIIIIADPKQRAIVRDKIEELRSNANMNI